MVKKSMLYCGRTGKSRAKAKAKKMRRMGFQKVRVARRRRGRRVCYLVKTGLWRAP